MREEKEVDISLHERTMTGSPEGPCSSSQSYVDDNDVCFFRIIQPPREEFIQMKQYYRRR